MFDECSRIVRVAPRVECGVVASTKASSTEVSKTVSSRLVGRSWLSNLRASHTQAVAELVSSSILSMDAQLQ